MVKPVLLLLALLSVAPAVHAEEELVSEYAAVLPGAEPLLDCGKVIAVRILGREGGVRRPLPGAVLSVYDEDTSPSTVRPPLLARATADEHGFANVTFDALEGGAVHLVAEAAGFGVGWRFYLPEEIVLEPAPEHSLLVLDPFGRPLPGAEVEVFPCCPHSPAVRAAVTDAAGRAVLDGWTEGDSFSPQLWIRAEGVDPGPYDLDERLVGQPAATVCTRPGRTARGVVLDEEGRPVPGAAVRADNYPRGPAEKADADGWFTLRGVPEGASVFVFDPRTPWPAWPAFTVAEFSEDVPLRIVLRRGRPTTLAEGEPRHTVEVQTPAGCPVTLTRLTDGFTATGAALYAGGEGFAGICRLAVPTGPYRAEVGGGFSRFLRLTTAARLPAPEDRPVRLLPIEPSKLVLDVPESPAVDWPNEIWLQIPGRAARVVGKRDVVWLPAEGPAGVRIRAREPYWREEVVPVGEEVGDERKATWRPPAPVTVRVLARDEAGEVPEAETFLGTENSELPDFEGGAGSRTMTVILAGRHRLWVAAPGRQTKYLDVDLPAAPGSVVDLGEVVLARTAERRIHVRDADGRGLPARLTDDELPGWPPIEVAEDAGAAVVLGPEPAFFTVAVEGCLPMRVALEIASPAEIVLPAGRLTLRVRDAAGADLEAVAYLDAERFASEEGPLTIRGIPDGPHTLIIGAPDCIGQVRRIVFRDGEAYEIDVVLRPR
jgi:hypothetical protein